MISIDDIRSGINKILVLGNHEGIIQSVLDFDYLTGKREGSIRQKGGTTTHAKAYGVQL